jgi:hypothetical protein
VSLAVTLAFGLRSGVVHGRDRPLLAAPVTHGLIGIFAGSSSVKSADLADVDATAVTKPMSVESGSASTSDVASGSTKTSAEAQDPRW